MANTITVEAVAHLLPSPAAAGEPLQVLWLSGGTSSYKVTGKAEAPSESHGTRACIKIPGQRVLMATCHRRATKDIYAATSQCFKRNSPSVAGLLMSACVWTKLGRTTAFTEHGYQTPIHSCR